MTDHARSSRRRFLRQCALGFGAAASAAGSAPTAAPSSPSVTMPASTPAATRFPVSDHCDGWRFFNPGPDHNRHWGHVLKWRLTSRAQPWPAEPLALNPPPLPPPPTGDRLIVTWINHSSFLLQTRVGAILCDPVYSERASPVNWAGPKRIHAPGVPLAALPPIRVVLLSHDHYDHCDLPTLRQLAATHQPLGITPLGNGDLLREAGFTHIVELDWWQQHPLAPDCILTATPAFHWSNRVLGLRNRRLWSGFHLRVGPRTLYFAGDTGYDDSLFRTLRTRLGPPEVALLPIGAYEPRWFMAPMHCNPLEAVKIHQELGAATSIAMHWGLWQLADDGRDDPPRDLRAALQQAGVEASRFKLLQPGESENFA